jgi:ATP-dependent helicase/nuclease subunit A
MLPDHDARRAALTDFAHNLVVTAGAGTGKTSLLVGRVLAALLCQHIDAGAVLAVTFTENAAAQMRARLLRLLRAVPTFVAGGVVEASDAYVLGTLGIGPEHVRRADDAIADLDRVALATFHGFCLRLLQEHAADLDLPAQLRVGTDEAVRARFERDYLAFLAQAADGEHASALEAFDASELRELAFALLTLPEEAWDELATPFAPRDLARRADELAALLAAYPRARAAWRDYTERLLLICVALRDGKQTDDDALFDKSTPKAGKKELGEHDDERATQALDAHRGYLRGLLLADEAAIACARAFLLPFLRAQRASRVHAGELSFDDLLLLTRRVLLDRPAVRKKLAQRFATILVDEFQDTDPLQYDVLFLLASDSARDPGTKVTQAHALPLRPCLFIVGDAKQSVYRFRRADVGAYFRTVELLGRADAHGRALVLTANFRSRPAVLRFVNTVCARTLAPDVPYQLGYAAVVPVRSEDARARVELLLLPRQEPGGRAFTRRVREGEALVQVLRGLCADGTKLSDVAILLRAAADTTWLLRPLRQAEIPYVLQGSRRFYSRQEVVLAGALLAAMARPFDAVPVLAVLRSALAGVTDQELLAYRQDGGEFDWRGNISAAGAVHDGLRFLADLHARTRGRPMHEVLPAILRHEELLLAEGAGFEGAQRLANLERLLHQLLRAAPIDVAEAAALVERRTLEETDDEESPLFDDDADAVRIMTVHAAKGLEFDVVIVPDLARRPPGDPDGERTPAQRSFTAEGTPLVAVRLAERENRAAQVARQEAARHQEAEERRLFYVAATRAKERLLLLGHDDENLVAASLWQRDLATAPLAEGGIVLRALELPAAGAPVARARDACDPAPIVRALANHRALAVRAAQFARQTTPGVPSELPAPDDSSRHGVVAREQARARGRAAHAYFALVDLARDGVDEELLARVCGDVAARRAVRPWLARWHGSPLRLRLRDAQRIERELAVTYRDPGGHLVHGVIDVLWQDHGGAWHVIDWKTDHDPDAARYRAQLDAYAHGVQRALELPLPPAAEAVFVAAVRDD